MKVQHNLVKGRIEVIDSDGKMIAFYSDMLPREGVVIFWRRLFREWFGVKFDREDR